MREYRLLITGSRDWTDVNAIRNALAEAWRAAQPARVTLVVGRCSSGADKIAEDLWVERGLPIEAHPADWCLGRNAGPARNKHMVEQGADLCLAFVGPCTSPRCLDTPPHDSHGTAGTVQLAANAGIPTHVVRAAVPPASPAIPPVTTSPLRGPAAQNGSPAS